MNIRRVLKAATVFILFGATSLAAQETPPTSPKNIQRADASAAEKSPSGNSLPDTPGSDTSQADRPAAEKAQSKVPAPPLFPKHRRGTYRNAGGDEVIDATPQSPPLDTDDPGVPDKGEYEINFTTQVDYATAAQRYNLLLVDANYGVLPVIAGHKLPTQLKIEFPLEAARDEDKPFTLGLGETVLGLKLNFYSDEHRGISVSVYPQIEFATGRSVVKGLAADGQTLVLPLLVARTFHSYTFVFNGGLEKPLHDALRETISTFGVAFGRALTRKDAAMLELRTESTLDFKSQRLVFLNVGYIHGVRRIIVYGNIGHSLFSDDGPGHTYVGVGMKLLIDPKKVIAAH
jgi:hypothetical protein